MTVSADPLPLVSLLTSRGPLVRVSRCRAAWPVFKARLWGPRSAYVACRTLNAQGKPGRVEAIVANPPGWLVGGVAIDLAEAEVVLAGWLTSGWRIETFDPDGV